MWACFFVILCFEMSESRFNHSDCLLVQYVQQRTYNQVEFDICQNDQWRQKAANLVAVSAAGCCMRGVYAREAIILRTSSKQPHNGG